MHFPKFTCLLDQFTNGKFLLFIYVYVRSEVVQEFGNGWEVEDMLAPQSHVLHTAIKFRVFVCLPRLSLIDVAVEVRSQLRKDKSVGKILDGKPKQTHACSPFAFSCRCGYSCSPHSKSCQT